MKTGRQQIDEEEIFHVARAIPSSEARSKYIEQVCGDDQALRERFEALLEVHEKEQSFLKSNRAVDPTADQSPITESPGQQIGRYKLLQKIGEGGFGVVYMAEQQRPVRRKVAFKIIKPGMDTGEVVARFEAERQALAMMDHPNIARVFDGGATESGRPYFVMELVQGAPITEFCDKNYLSMEERLQLFRTTCHAVQHAHQKGIIHRDLKPSNVLVTLADGQPVVKVIDFGVAKAMNQQLTEKTLFTSYGQMVGTPQYMSPEQAEMSCLDIDTRSDVYSLGVLLYELLTGKTPLESERLRTAGYVEMQRLIREEEPPTPSARLSTSGNMLTVIAKHRSVSPEKLKHQVQGDLDWIVMKALEKDRNRRYESPNSLGEDITNFLESEPVDARPPTFGYRTAKYLKRNRVAVMVTSLLVAALGLGLVGTASQAIKAKGTLKALGEASYEQAINAALLGDGPRARGALEGAAEAGVPSGRLKVADGLIALNDGDYVRSAEIAQELLRDDPQHIGAQALLVSSRLWSGYFDEWVLESGRLAKASPKTDLDELMMAHALLLYDSKFASELIDNTERLKHSPIGLLLRSIDRATRATDEQSDELTTQAVQDYSYLSFLLPKSHGVMAWRAAALAQAIEFNRSRGQNIDAFVAEGRELLLAFPNANKSPFLNYCKWELCRAVGKDKDALEAASQAGNRGFFCFFTAAECLLQHNSSSDALAVFDDAMSARDENDKHVRIARAFIVHDSPDGASRVRDLIDNLTTGEHGLTSLWALNALCLAGDVKFVQTRAPQDQRYEPLERFGQGACLEYLGRPPSLKSEELLLKRAGRHAFALANAHFTIAMTRMALGDRPGAIDHLEQSTQNVAVGNLGYEMARAILYRMKSDPNYPFWLENRSTN